MLNIFKSLPVPPPQIKPPAPPENIDNQEGIRKAQREACAIVRSLKPHLEARALSDSALWKWVKSSHKVTSRSELTESQWVTLAARLFAAEKDDRLFSVLCDAITANAGNCRAYRIHANATFRKIYDGIITADIEERCQRHADTTGCRVRLHGSDGADGIIFFEPVELAYDPDCPPIGEFDPNKPARAYEVRTQGKVTHLIEIPFPDTPKLEAWGQAYADKTGFDINITDRQGHYVLMHFTAPPTPPRVVQGVIDVTIDGQKWILLNREDDQYHWFKFDGTMEKYIVTADNHDSAVDLLVAYVDNKA